MNEPLYITVDVETAGSRLGHHSTLSFGACVVRRIPYTAGELFASGEVFYAEVKPDSTHYEMEAMRVGCSHLICLEEERKTDSRFDPTHENFEPTRVLRHLYLVAEDPRDALMRFHAWIEKVATGVPCVGVTDTVFFDSGRFDFWFGKHFVKPSPFGWKGLDLDSTYKGYARRGDASLKELNLPDTRLKPHRADHDAIFLAQIARVLLFEKMGW